MAFKSSSVINLVYSYRASQTRFEYSLLFEWCYYRGLFFAISLPPSADSACMIYQHLISQRTVNKTSWSNPRQTRICYIFRLWVIIKALLKRNSFRIRIILLTCPDNKSAKNHQPKSCMPAKSHKSQWCEASIISVWNLRSLCLFLACSCEESTTTKFLLRHLNCRGSPLFKSRR